MHLKNVVIVVKNIERSKKFYQELFGLQVIRDFESNVILTEGLVLQEKESWENGLGEESACGCDHECFLKMPILMSLWTSLMIIMVFSIKISESIAVEKE
jgi:catechol-2,3-dioxygenase